MGRVSVPLWLIILSNQLRIIGLGGFYPTNYLILRRLIKKRLNLSKISRIYAGLFGRFLRVTHPFATLFFFLKKAYNLHVLSLLRAFILSQDQTHKFIFLYNFSLRESPLDKSSCDSFFEKKKGIVWFGRRTKLWAHLNLLKKKKNWPDHVSHKKTVHMAIYSFTIEFGKGSGGSYIFIRVNKLFL